MSKFSQKTLDKCLDNLTRIEVNVDLMRKLLDDDPACTNEICKLILDTQESLQHFGMYIFKLPLSEKENQECLTKIKTRK